MIWEFLPPGQQSTFGDYQAANFSRPGRRDLSSDLSPTMANAQRWGYLIEKGKNYWEQGILPAFEGRSPFSTPSWTERDLFGDETLDTGWAWKDEPGKDLPAHWKDAFELIPEGNQAGRNQETSFVSLDHNAAFTNTQGDTDVVSQPSAHPSLQATILNSPATNFRPILHLHPPKRWCHHHNRSLQPREPPPRIRLATPGHARPPPGRPSRLGRPLARLARLARPARPAILPISALPIPLFRRRRHPQPRHQAASGRYLCRSPRHHQRAVVAATDI